MLNEMLVTEDKYESYRLGYKRGHDRGYEFRQQQDEADILKLQERISYLGSQYANAAQTIRQLKEERAALQHEVTTLKRAHGVTESMLKIAYNDIAAFIASEDRMREEINGLEYDLKLAKRAI